MLLQSGYSLKIVQIGEIECRNGHEGGDGERREVQLATLAPRADVHQGNDEAGTKHTQPVYGKDMQDALSRLIKKELTKKVENKLETSTGFVFVVWVTLMLLPAMFVNAQSPWFLAYVFGSIALLTVVAIAWYNHVNKGE